ncbi:MAG: peptidylprolyl isomerase [Pseudomonadota bacterium]
MPHLFTRLAIAGLATFAISSPALAQDALEPDTVLATVNGYEITEDEAQMASQDFAEQLQRVPDDQRRAVIVDALIDLHLLAGAGEEEGLADGEAFQRRLAYQRARTLRTAYLVDVLAPQVDDEALQTAYDEAVAGFEPEEERKARHILVESEDEARAVIEELDGGADFAELATERSTGPSGPNGGDLGFFSRGRMVPVFEDAAFSLEVGSYTPDPVESRFGWHVIYLEEVRESEAPAFEELAPQIQQGLLQQAFVDAIGGLREEAAISYEVEGLEPPAAPE